MEHAKTTAEAAPPPAPRHRSALKLVFRAWAVPEVGALIPLAVFTLAFAALNPALLGPQSVSSLLRAVQFIGIIAVGQALLIVCGELDLSVGAVAGLSAVLTAWLVKQAGCPVPLAISAGLLAGAAAGLVNGLVTVKLGVPAFITTLGMLYVARGGAYLVSSARIYGLSPSLVEFGAARPLGTSWPFCILLAVAVVADLTLRFTTFGRAVYATGGNREVARVAGINTDRVKITCFVLTGALSALAGVLLMATFNVGQPQTGENWELDVIAAVVIGGTSLFGGVGTVAGAFLGLLIMQVVRNGLVMTGVNPHWQTVSIGVIMVAAVAFDLFRRRAKT